jgi:hypothetical protein
MAQDDPTKAPEFQKVIRHFVTTPHKPHEPIGKARRKRPATWPGTLVLGDSPQLLEAFNAIREGLRSGRHIDELSRHSEILEEAWDQALRTPEGLRYLEFRPTLKQQVGRNREKSGL